MSLTTRPTIGVFDSGFGGLTVLRALLPLIPDAHYIYLGDTARLPYGSKSRQTVARYAVESAHFLVSQGADILVIACNTATALALPEIVAAVPVPVVGVIEPGARSVRLSAKELEPFTLPAFSPGSKAGNFGSFGRPWTAEEAQAFASKKVAKSSILVLATTATVESKAYTREFQKLGLTCTEKACPLLVPLIEEGWKDHQVTQDVLRVYLSEAFKQAPRKITDIVLGCTHYPLLKPQISRMANDLGNCSRVVDAAQATAEATAALLPGAAKTGTPSCTFYATDSIEKFERLGPQFLGRPLTEVKLLDLGG